MLLHAPTNWDDELLPQLADLGIGSVYGKATRDAVGGGRASVLLPEVGLRRAGKHIQRARSLGLHFDYLINASCMDNVEVTRAGHARIVKLLQRVREYGADRVTVSTPLMVRLVAEVFPDLAVGLSVFALVDTPHRLSHWERMGVQQVTLREHYVNRDFAALRLLRDATELQLQLVANNACLAQCPFESYHAAALSHASQAGHASGGFFMDYSFMSCRRILLEDPIEAIRSTWIRPEDVPRYEQLGIDSLKLVDRVLPTEDLVRIARAYAEQRYDGDLADIVPGLRGFAMPRAEPMRLRYMAHPLKANPLRLASMKELREFPRLRIDNRALDGFLDPFVAGLCCRATSCADCDHCGQFAERALRIDEDERRRYLDVLSRQMSRLERGGA